MPPRFVLTPFFLEQHLPSAIRLMQTEWRLNETQDVRRHLASVVADDARAGDVPVSVAGDCLQSLAVVAGLQRAGIAPVVVWLDAHGDFNTPETSPSGFIGGMPLAMLAGRGDQSLMAAVGATPIAESDLILADARDLDPGERAALDASAVRRTGRPSDIAAMLPPGRAVYVHFDTDVIDPADAPAVLYPTTGGPRLAEVREALGAIGAAGRVVAVSLTLWQLDDDHDRVTENACLSALTSLLTTATTTRQKC